MLLCMLLFTVSCQDKIEEVLPSKSNNLEKVSKSINQETSNNVQGSLLELNIPVYLQRKLDIANNSSGWIKMNHAEYEGDIMIVAGSDSLITSITIRGEVAQHLSADFLVNLMDLPEGDTQLRIQPIKYLLCFGNCMGGRPWHPINIGGCAVACALER